MVNRTMLHIAFIVCFCLCSRTLQMKLCSDDQSENKNPVRLVDVDSALVILAGAQRHRIEALIKTITSLDARVRNETFRLGITGHKESLTYTKPTGDKHAADRKEKKESVSNNKNVHMKKEIKTNVGKWLACSLTDKQEASLQNNRQRMKKMNESLNVNCR